MDNAGNLRVAVIIPCLNEEATIGRVLGPQGSEFHWVNRIGNRILLRFLSALFSARVTDLLSGYRAMTREFVKQVPVLSAGFELATELSVLAFERGSRTVGRPREPAHPVADR